MKDQDLKDKFVEMRARGLSYVKIAMKLHVSKNTLIRWAKDLAGEILKMKSDRLKELCEKHLMAKERRVELFGEQVLRLREELADRDLSELGTPELLRLYLRYLGAVSREIEPIRVDLAASDPLAAYKDILERCLELPPGMTRADVPAVAAQMASAVPGSRPKVDQNVTENSENQK